MKSMAIAVWKWVPDKSQVLMTTLVVCVVLTSIGGAAIGVDIPFKDKTLAEWYLDDRYENWRLHFNTEELFIASDKAKELKDECKELKREIRELRRDRWHLMSSQNLSKDVKYIELDKMNTELGDIKKKLLAAESGFQAAIKSYDILLAQR